MHTTTKLPRRTVTAAASDPSGCRRRSYALGATLFTGLVAVGVLALPSASGETPPVGPPTWQDIAASTSIDVDGN